MDQVLHVGDTRAGLGCLARTSFVFTHSPSVPRAHPFTLCRRVSPLAPGPRWAACWAPPIPSTDVWCWLHATGWS